MDPKCVSGARESPDEQPYVFGVTLNQLSHAFLRHDPCESRYFVPVRMRNVDHLLDARSRLDILNETWAPVRRDVDHPLESLGWDPAFARVLSCEAPKLRLVPQALFVEGDARAYGVVKTTPAIDEVVVIPRPSSPGEATPGGAPPAGAGAVRVLGFSANSLELETDWPASESTWLVYADAHHPDWQATVDGRAVPVEAAYGAFKAVRVPPGKSRVEFRYRGVIRPNPILALATLGVVCWLALLGFIFLQEPGRPGWEARESTFAEPEPGVEAPESVATG
jgi:hypothetical protein